MANDASPSPANIVRPAWEQILDTLLNQFSYSRESESDGDSAMHEGAVRKRAGSPAWSIIAKSGRESDYDSLNSYDAHKASQELPRHSSRERAIVKCKYICIEPLDGVIHDGLRPVSPLANCNACRSEKKYDTYHNAAAHLRIAHFKSKEAPQRRAVSNYKNLPQQFEITGWPPTSKLKRWMKEVDNVPDSIDQSFEPSRFLKLPAMVYPMIFPLYISNLGPEVDENVLNSLFKSRFMACECAQILEHPLSGDSPSFGIVVFSDEGECQRAFREMQGAICGSRPISISKPDLPIFESDKHISQLVNDSRLVEVDLAQPRAKVIYRDTDSPYFPLGLLWDRPLHSSAESVTFYSNKDEGAQSHLSPLNEPDFPDYGFDPSNVPDFQCSNGFEQNFAIRLEKPVTWNQDNDIISYQPEQDLRGLSKDRDQAVKIHDVEQEVVPSNIAFGPGNVGLECGIPTTQVTATDSGYASLRNDRDIYNAVSGQDDNAEDDSASVLTDNQDLEIQDDVKERLISEFASEIFQHVEALLGNVDRNRSLKKQLAGLLKNFSIKLRDTTDLGRQTDATVFVRHYRNRIANSLETCIKQSFINNDLIHDDHEEEEKVYNPLKAEKGLTLQEKMEKLMWNAPEANNALRDSFDHQNIEEEDDRDIEGYAISHFADAWKFLTESQAFKWFLGKLSAILLTDSQNSLLDQISKDIIQGLHARTEKRKYNDIYEAHFNIDDWSLSSFLKEQYPEEQHIRLKSIITITGSSIDAQALTCAEYMRQVWPTTGLETLKALQEAVDGGFGISYECTMSDRTQITVTILDARVCTVVKGTEPAITEIGQQLAWLGAALRTSPLPLGIALCTPKVTTLNDKRIAFMISFQLMDIKSNAASNFTNGTCWRDLFRNPVVVDGYPILARLHEEKGLELPLNMMSGLGEASRATNFDGGILIKGFSTLFAPMKRITDSIQWHYLFERDGSRISYLAADDQCPGRVRLDKVDNSCLQFSRNFLGWTSSVDAYAGTKDVKYKDIDWPGTNLASAGVAFEKASIVMGNYITGGASFTRGNKDTPIYLCRGGPYEQEIHFASRMKAVLYDVGDRRGWLVDGASALLHLTRTQLALSPYSDSSLFKIKDFVHANPADGMGAAKKALLNPKNRKLSIFEQVEITTESKATKEEETRIKKTWTYQDLVKQTYHILEQIHDYETKILTSPTIALHLTNRERLMGFAFMDIADGQNDLRPRITILRSSGKGWVDFTRSIRAITLLGKGFGEIFRPSEDSNILCKRWKHVPTGKDYLAASISLLKDICKRHGSEDTKSLELAHRIYWHNPDKLFESCDCKQMASLGGCDRVQILLPPSLGSKRNPQPFRHQKGAVVFGRSRRLPWRWPNRGDPVPGELSDSEPDDSSDFHDSGLGSSDRSQTESSNSRNVESPIPISNEPGFCLDSAEINLKETLNRKNEYPMQQNPNQSETFQRPEVEEKNIPQGSLGADTICQQEIELSESSQIPETQRSTPLISPQEAQTERLGRRKRTWDQLKDIPSRLSPRQKKPKGS